MKSLEFKKELEQLINKYSVENGSDTPDFILANYLMNCLQSYEIAIDCREKWYGRKDKNDPVGFKDIEDCKWNKDREKEEMRKEYKEIYESGVCQRIAEGRIPDIDWKDTSLGEKR